jgi:hypothetical protein
MQELVQRVVDQTGIPEETATQVIDVIVGYVKEHAPAPIANQIESYLTGEGATSSVGAAAGALGGMFGKKKDDTTET